MQTQYGIRNINKFAVDEDVARCNNCWHYFYDEIIDERNDNTLIILRDGEDFFYKGCPICKTDAYLTDVSMQNR
ncbi:hypothetical protein AGMMS49982_09890 [Bacteroidia bacterium]|nr:hypothetical protein AGMMS49982_09890 [Bacteroidia bacterium]